MVAPSQSRLRRPPQPTKRPRPASRWCRASSTHYPQKKQRTSRRWPAEVAAGLRPSSGQQIRAALPPASPAISLGRANRASTHATVSRVPLRVSRPGRARRRSRGADLRGSGFRRRAVEPSQRRGRQRRGRHAAARAVDRVLVDDGWATIEWIAARNPDRVFDCLGYPTDENTHLQATQLRAELAGELARPPTAPRLRRGRPATRFTHLKCRPAPGHSARPLQRSRARKTPRLTADRIRKRD